MAEGRAKHKTPLRGSYGLSGAFIFMEVDTIKRAFKIDRTHAKRSPAEAIFLGLQVLGPQEDEAAMFRAWCALQLSEELAEIPHMKPSVLQAALRELEGLEWVVVTDEKQAIKIII